MSGDRSTKKTTASNTLEHFLNRKYKEKSPPPVEGETMYKLNARQLTNWV